MHMRKTLAAALLAFGLLASPAYAAGPRPPIYRDIGKNFVTGATFYYTTIAGWVDTLLDLVGIKQKLTIAQQGEPCTRFTHCAPGLVCLNSCIGGNCARYEKACLPGPPKVDVLGEYSICGPDDLCVIDTYCTRTCPPGVNCGDEGYRCMKPVDLGTSCSEDTECVEACGTRPFPPIGPSAYVARCSLGTCHCDPIETQPDAERVACPDGIKKNLVCPAGTWAVCTPKTDCPSGNCAPVLTCLTSPDYGGTCLVDAGCAQASCPEGAEPFCGEDRQCKCRKTEALTISCQTAADCGASVCDATEIAACVEGACACAPAAVVNSCQTASDCAECPSGYASSCENNSCLCTKTKENVPVACNDVSECSSVACPDGYDKACLENVCSCTRTIEQ